ncbi:MAG: N-acyl homoserine lactonase family protein [Gammaproteobacteria bacterium]|nr:N-acyl homoserine lactonase family protein [Gammaproteobacteria bacterium]
MKKWISRLAAVAVLGLGAMTTAHAVSPAGMKLYVFSSGSMMLGKGFLQNLAPMEPKIQVPIGFFVVKHPKGNVLFDTGNNDKLITDSTYWGKLASVFEVKMTPEDAIDAQLAKIGLKPDDIKYVVVSHMHLDHGGNVGKFPNSTLIIQDDELSFAMFPDEPFAGGYIPGDSQVLRSPVGTSKPSLMDMVRLEGDYDIFGDGSVVVHRSRGHTKGSQMLMVRLPKTGSTILTGDAVYFRENIEKNLIPNIALAYDPVGIVKGYDWVRRMKATENANYFTAHDPDAFKAMKKAPEFYE